MNETKSKYSNPSDDEFLEEILWLGLRHLRNFGENSKLMADYFLNLSEYAQDRKSFIIHDLATDLMLYAEEVETSTYATKDPVEIIEIARELLN